MMLYHITQYLLKYYYSHEMFDAIDLPRIVLLWVLELGVLFVNRVSKD